MTDPRKFHLQITGGTSYDPATHQLLPVNTSTPLELHSDHLDGQVDVRINNFRGLPSGSPPTCDYFSKPPHQSDLYSISFNFKLKESIPGNELLFGNDFEHPIKDNLPPGFSTALRIVKWAIDPGLDGDVYADKPYLYGPLASSINQLWIGDKPEEASPKNPHPYEQGEAVKEGGSEAGLKIREEKSVPSDGAARMKHFLNEAHRKDWHFEAGREYRCDFFNPYLDFNDLALKLPGNFKLHLMSFWDGQPLRYTLKHKTADGSKDKVLFVIVFTLVPEERAKEQEKKLEREKKTSTVGKVGGIGLGGQQRDMSVLAGGASAAGASGQGPADDGGVD